MSIDKKTSFYFTPRRIIICVVFFAIAIAADQITKAWARNVLKDHSDYIGSSHIGFSLTTNSGSAFSLFQSSTMYLTIIGIIAVLLLLIASFRARTWAAYCYMAIAIGATGNIIDRFAQVPYHGHGHVTDFIRIGSWPTFNIADSLVTLGALALVIQTFFLQGKTPQKKVNDES